MIICKEGVCPALDVPKCCRFCEKSESCPECCDMADNPECESQDEVETNMTVFTTHYAAIMKKISDVVLAKKAAEEQERKLKDQLREAMELYQVKSVDNQFLKVTYIAPSTATTIDSAALKKKYPAIADECSKISKKSAYVKIEVKDGGNE